MKDDWVKREKAKLEKIHKRGEKAKKSFKNRALLVIETLCGNDITWTDQNRIDIYEIAHVALGTCSNPHEDWVKKTEDLFTAFEKGGLI